jgi:hypothetical protein
MSTAVVMVKDFTQYALLVSVFLERETVTLQMPTKFFRFVPDARRVTFHSDVHCKYTCLHIVRETFFLVNFSYKHGGSAKL